ncbi:GGDEF domain-containing protein [Herbaspirillum sp. AP02]|uniref:sensor domain-containing diguanylate cyclase n=1 Tax=unclassified Herbaspirillum TaxID=2624150 RepID=UPI0015DAE549|nr:MULTISPECIES: sensor domain-containing diguanylate cyclase [unclassified Herbaspirillum]MBG7621106.1 GGDEF domain-containing protein [Herbaspirillum sp. AP02]NZD68835.1 GGDEF domain-containing protein [Herbaspirillum sp. AP21]
MRPILAKAGRVARHSVARRARLFVILTCIAIAAGHTWQSLSARLAQVDNTRIYSGNIAKALARHAYDVFQATHGSLINISDRIYEAGVDPARTRGMSPLLHQLSKEMPQLDGLYIYDAAGNRMASSSTPRAADANNADREYFIYHRDHEDTEPRISPTLVSRSTGNWVIPMSRRLNHPDGSFAGVLLATLRVDHFNALYQTVDIGKSSSILLVLRPGTVLTRQPFESDYIGRDITADAGIRQLLDGRASGHAEILSPLDDTYRYLSYQSVQAFPLVVTVTIARDEALADWRQQTIVYGAAVSLLLIIIAMFGWRLIGQIELRLVAEDRALQVMGELRLANKQLELLAHQDGLTTLANRRHLDMVLEAEFRRATRSGAALSLVMIDVDFFKQYNDLYGHQAGDECLRRIALVLKERQRRPGDLAARYGGEEMVMLLPDTDAEGAMVVAEKIRGGIQALDLGHRGNPLGVVTVSAGVCALDLLEGASRSVEELLGRADAALYEAKRGGRNQVRVAQAGIPAPAPVSSS